ncbi:phage tail assembly protein [Comamonas terrigena]|uniref:phage tail assembly protein n=1 Tax=Comamonas terrigena TaxID=32013 RepID=UPI0023561D51
MPGTKTATTATAAIEATADTATEVTAAAEAAAVPAKPDNTVTLDFPIKRGAGEITEITLRKPMAGELRGVKLTDLLTLEAGAVRLLLPRVTIPTLLPHEVDQLDPADFTELATMVAGFFVRKSTREALLTA